VPGGKERIDQLLDPVILSLDNYPTSAALLEYKNQDQRCPEQLNEKWFFCSIPMIYNVQKTSRGEKQSSESPPDTCREGLQQ